MELIEAVINRRVGMVEASLLTPELAAINQLLYAVDIVRHKMELKYGIGRLLELTPPELRAKFDSQMKKLEAAVIESNVALVEELVGGCCRGWAALDAAAVKNGHVPFEPQFWEVAAADGVVYRVVRHIEELEAVPQALRERLVSLQELVNGYHAQNVKVFKTPSNGSERVFRPFSEDNLDNM